MSHRKLSATRPSIVLTAPSVRAALVLAMIVVHAAVQVPRHDCVRVTRFLAIRLEASPNLRNEVVRSASIVMRLLHSSTHADPDMQIHVQLSELAVDRCRVPDFTCKASRIPVGVIDLLNDAIDDGVAELCVANALAEAVQATKTRPFRIGKDLLLAIISLVEVVWHASEELTARAEVLLVQLECLRQIIW